MRVGGVVVVFVVRVRVVAVGGEVGQDLGLGVRVVEPDCAL